jgi:hypothetical protein
VGEKSKETPCVFKTMDGETKEILLEVDDTGKFINHPLTVWTTIHPGPDCFHLLVPFDVEQKGKIIVLKGWKRVNSRVDISLEGKHLHIDIFERVEMDLRFISIEGAKIQV